MSPSILKITAFTTGCIVTAVVWSLLNPSPEKLNSAPPQPPHVVAKKQPWPAGKTVSLIASLNQADSDEAKVRAAIHLLAIPNAEIDEAFNGIVWKDGKRLALAAKVLLIRMASDDGKSTMFRAWERLNTEGLWPQAFAQIGPAWAAHDPAGLAAWATHFAGNPESEDKGTTEKKSDHPDGPTLDFQGLTDVSGWLVTEEPEAAYQLLLKRGGFSSDDQSLPLTLFSSGKVKEALLAFGDMRVTDPNRVEGDQIQLYYLLQRWNELDPVGFDSSPYALTFPSTNSQVLPLPVGRWMEVPAEQRANQATRIIDEAIPINRANLITELSRKWADSDPDACAEWLDSLPPEELESVNKARAHSLAPHELNRVLDHFNDLPPEPWNQALVTAFDAWTKAHPGQRADRSGWPAKRVTAWEDLEALLPGKSSNP